MNEFISSTDGAEVVSDFEGFVADVGFRLAVLRDVLCALKEEGRVPGGWGLSVKNGQINGNLGFIVSISPPPVPAEDSRDILERLLPLFDMTPEEVEEVDAYLQELKND